MSRPYVWDLDPSGADDGQVVTFDAASGRFIPADPTGGGGGGYTDPLTTKGDLVGRSSSATGRVPAGTNGYALLADSSATFGVAWTDLNGIFVPKSLIDAKGDLLVGTADNTIARRAVGSNDQVLTADSAQADGVKWATPTPLIHASRSVNVATAGNDTLTLGAAPYEESLQIFKDGKLLRPTTDWTIAGAVVTFTLVLAGGEVIQDSYLATTSGPSDSVLSGTSAVVYVQNTFTKANENPIATAGEVGGVPSVSAAIWQILSNELKIQSSQGEGKITWDTGHTTYRYKIKQTAIPADGGYPFRANGTTTMGTYLLLYPNVGASRWDLYSQTGGAFTLLTNAGSAPAINDDIEIYNTPTTVDVWINGVHIINAFATTAFASGTRVGVRQNGGNSGAWKNMLVTSA